MVNYLSKIIPPNPIDSTDVACQSETDSVLDTLEASNNVRAAEAALFRAGFIVQGGWHGPDGERVTRIRLKCDAYLEYGTFDDDYVILTDMHCDKFPRGP
jgi:hypothetical protein